MQQTTATTKVICSSFARSIGWIATLGGGAIFFHQLADIVIVDFIQVNPNRSRQNAASLPFLFTGIFTVIIAVGLMLSCFASQVVQAILTKYCLRELGVKGLYWVLAAVPVTAILTWYSYDYLVPSNFGFFPSDDPGWTPYRHGLTPLRYLAALGFQFLVTAFCLQRLRFKLEGPAKASRILLAGIFGTGLVLGISSGVWSGIKSTSQVVEPPKEGQLPASTFHLDPIHEWTAKLPRGSTQWSPDGLSLLSLPAYGGQLDVLDQNGQLQTTKTLPIPFTFHLILDPTHVVLVGSTNTRVLFYVVDLTSGNTVFQEKIPPDTEPGVQGAVYFTASQDGSMLAVAYSALQQGEPISIYDTRHWTKVVDAHLPVATGGLGEMAFSYAGNLLAVETGQTVAVVDAHTGALLQSIPLSGRWLAISHDEHKIAVEESDLASGMVQSKSVKVFQLSNGAQIAEYPLQSPEASCTKEGSCPTISKLFWSADDDSLIFAGGKTLHVWKPLEGQKGDIVMFSPLVSSSLALSPDGNTLAISTGNIVSFYDMTKL